MGVSDNSQTLEPLSPKQRELVQQLNTPKKVQDFLKRLKYNFENHGSTLRTLPGVLEHKEAHCLEAALSAAAILELHDYPPLFLDLVSADKLDHVLFLYREKGKWGTVARSRDPGLHGRKAVFSSVESLVRSYRAPFVDHSGRIKAYGTYDLRKMKNYNWRGSTRNVWKVQEVLRNKRDKPFPTPDKEYEYWHKRYLVYKKRYPKGRPNYFPNKENWL